MLWTTSRLRLANRRRALAAIAACATAVAPATAASAGGAPSPIASASALGAGDVTLTVAGKGRAAKALAAADVKVGAIAPAKRRGKRVTLPVQSVSVAKAATVALRGGIRFKAGKRSLALKSVRLGLTAKRATVSAKAGKLRLVFFTASLSRGTAKLDRSAVTAKLAGAKLALTPKAARLLSAKLDVGGIQPGPLGQLGVDAKAQKRDGGGSKPGPGPGGGVPQSGPIKSEPPVMQRPATAVDVGNVAIAWYPRDSWVRYLASGVGPGDGIFASDGATKRPPMTTPDHPCFDVAYSGSGSFDYGFDFTPKSGWFDPPTQTAAIYGQGSVKFKWQTHTIDLVASDPEIELNPTDPRTIFRFNGSGGTAYPNQRAALTKLDLAGQPTVAGNTRTYTAVRGRLTEDGQAVFAGFYPPPGDQFGCVTVSFTTP